MKRFTLLFALVGIAGSSQAALVFDDISAFQSGTPGAGRTSTGTTPNTFMGGAYSLLPGTTAITGFDLFVANGSGTNFTGLRLNVYVWDTVNMGAVSAASPAFSNLLGSYSLTAVGTFNSGAVSSFQGSTPGAAPRISLATPLAISDTTVGITFNFQGTTDGVTYSSVNNLTSLITYGVAPTVGDNLTNGFYRNANGETNGNFTSGVRSLGLTNQNVALRVFGNVQATPEPSAFVAMGLGAATLLRRRKRA